MSVISRLIPFSRPTAECRNCGRRIYGDLLAYEGDGPYCKIWCALNDVESGDR